MIAISKHAREQATRRGVSGEIILAVARSPEQRIVVRPGREVRQSRVAMSVGGIPYLVRVVVDTGPGNETVVTAYRKQD